MAMANDMLAGKIIKGVGGLYEVYTEELGVVTCSAKGILRYNKVKPLIGDDVELQLSEPEQKRGNIVAVKERRNALLRPAVANVDQAMIVFAMKDPEPHLNLLDRFLILMQQQDVPVIICFNKSDRAEDGQEEELRRIYEGCGAELHFVEARAEGSLEEVMQCLRGKTTVLAGPSGVGKSTIMNVVQPEARMETGSISEKIRRGKHTTRHSQLVFVDKDTYLLDTPGFSSLYLFDLEPEDLTDYYPEFATSLGACRFPNCQHLKEPDCAVKEKVENGAISRERYDSYVLLHEELSQKKRR